MAGRGGTITVEYEGQVTGELGEYLRTFRGARLVNLRPLTIVTDRPVEVLTRIYGFLTGPEMGVRRIRISGERQACVAA